MKLVKKIITYLASFTSHSAHPIGQFIRFYSIIYIQATSCSEILENPNQVTGNLGRRSCLNSFIPLPNPMPNPCDSVQVEIISHQFSRNLKEKTRTLHHSIDKFLKANSTQLQCKSNRIINQINSIQTN